jgi:diaminopimelate decarboxylase
MPAARGVQAKDPRGRGKSGARIAGRASSRAPAPGSPDPSDAGTCHLRHGRPGGPAARRGETGGQAGRDHRRRCCHGVPGLSIDVSKRLALFPINTRIVSEGSEPGRGSERLEAGGCDLVELAEQYGTPLYLYDQATLDANLRAYRQALSDSYPGAWGITYAGKAFLNVALAQWVLGQGLWVDCTGVGELTIAQAAGAQREQILMHGVNKSAADLTSEMVSAGTIVVDSLVELERLASMRDQAVGLVPNLWLRLRPGLAVETHSHTQTGQEDSKFGMSEAEALEAIRLCRHHDLPLTGLHFHQGSQFRDPAPIGPAIEKALDLAVALRGKGDWLPEVLCPGGGWGVPYAEDDLPFPAIRTYVDFVAQRLAEGCRRRNLPLPKLQLEPGRSLVAQAGVALYRVGYVKYTAHQRWVLLDGGLADNPRPALYGSGYTALPVQGPGRSSGALAWLAGPYCESGDILIRGLPFPEVEPGELVAVPMSGAYQLSMASNYNGACKPAVVWLRGGASHLVQRREEPGDLLRRDIALEAV